ncbi:MAG: universal stress protein, partial [Nitrososphaerales archaeon]
MKILLAVDDSATSEAVMTLLIDQVKVRETEVRLLQVVDPYPERLAKRMGSHDSPDFAAARMKQRAFAGELLERATERLCSAGFSVSSSIEEGDVRAVILEEAKAGCAGLIVLGSRQRKGIRHFFSGSISQDVARDAPCSVEIVRSQTWAIGVSVPCPQ